MFSMTLICMGKLKEKFYIQASEEYKKRLGTFCDFTLLELPEVRLPENPNETQILQRAFEGSGAHPREGAEGKLFLHSCPGGEDALV